MQNTDPRIEQAADLGLFYVLSNFTMALSY